MLKKIFNTIPFLLLPNLAQACVTVAGIDLRDIFSADLIVVGKVSNYQIIGDSQRKLLSNYAKFEIKTTETLYGNAPTSITVTWDNSTFGEPDTFDDSDNFIFALRDPNSAQLPLRGLSATILPNPEPSILTILQAPCASPFIFESKGNVGRAIRQIFDGKGDPKMKANVLAQYLGMTGRGGF